MTGARVCVATNEVGSTPIMFRSSDTLDAVAGRFHHDRSSNLLDVKTTAGGGLFIALPLNTELARLRDEGDLEGDGSGDNPFIVRVERAAGGGQQGAGDAGAVAGSPEAVAKMAAEAAVAAVTAAKGVTTISMSQVGSTVWNSIVLNTQLSVEMGVTMQPTTRQVPFYTWDERTERAQKKEYMAHLRSILRLPAAYDLYDADKFSQLLSWAEPLGDPPIRLKGTTDAFVCRKDASRMPQFELLVLFELKKKVETSDLPPTMAEQLSAALLPGASTTPITVLTDLRESWDIFWLDGRTMRNFQATAASAMGIIDSVVARAVVPTAAGAPAAAPVPEDDPMAPVHKRARLTLPRDVAEADVAPLHDLMDFDDLPESERQAMLHHALQRDLRRLCEPAFSSREEAGAPLSMYC